MLGLVCPGVSGCWGLCASGLVGAMPCHAMPWHACYGATVVSVVRLDKSSFADARLPRYEALRGEKLPDLETTVILPDSIFQLSKDRRESRA